MCIFICVYLYVCICVYIYMCVYLYMCIFICVYTFAMLISASTLSVDLSKDDSVSLRSLVCDSDSSSLSSVKSQKYSTPRSKTARKALVGKDAVAGNCLVGSSRLDASSRIVSTRPRGVSKQKKIIPSPLAERKFSEKKVQFS